VVCPNSSSETAFLSAITASKSQLRVDSTFREDFHKREPDFLPARSGHA